jgi:hypothetical protein
VLWPEQSSFEFRNLGLSAQEYSAVVLELW